MILPHAGAAARAPAIRGYRALVDRRRVGLGLGLGPTIFVEIKASGHSSERARVRAGGAYVDAVIACHVLSRTADFLLEVVVADLAAYERLLPDTLLELPGVSDVCSNIAIRTVKESAPLPLETV